MTDRSYTAAGLSRRGRKLMLSGVIALAAIGYVVGLRAGVPDGRPGLPAAVRLAAPSVPSGPVVPALSYAEVGAGRLRVPPGESGWAEMAAGLRAPASKPVIDAAVRVLSLGVRGERRAFNGAPPTIPHDVRGLSDAACLACHGQALRIGERVARELPHPHYANCRQCHAPSAPAFLAGEGGLLAPSSWEGVPAPREGPRAAPGAPPAVPHTLQMRENCAACHGPQGWPGMQTSHPERRNCLQCHAPIQDPAHPGRTLEAPPFLPAPRIAR